MGLFFRDCSICSAPAEVRAAVNEALRKREKLRDIAARSGFSKSALHRHSQKCVPRETLSRYRDARHESGNYKGFCVEWPEGIYGAARLRYQPIENLIDGAPIFVVEYAKPIFEQSGYLDELHEAALAENAERDTTKQILATSDNGNVTPE